MSIFQKSEKEILKDRKWYIFICKLVKQEGRGKGKGKSSTGSQSKERKKKKVNQWEREPNVCYHGLERSKIKRKEDQRSRIELGYNWGLIVIIDRLSVIRTAFQMGRGNKEDLFFSAEKPQKKKLIW